MRLYGEHPGRQGQENRKPEDFHPAILSHKRSPPFGGGLTAVTNGIPGTAVPARKYNTPRRILSIRLTTAGRVV